MMGLRSLVLLRDIHKQYFFKVEKNFCQNGKEDMEIEIAIWDFSKSFIERKNNKILSLKSVLFTVKNDKICTQAS